MKQLFRAKTNYQQKSTKTTHNVTMKHNRIESNWNTWHEG